MIKLFRSIQKKFGIAFNLINRFGWKKFIFEIIPWLFHKRFIFYAGPISGSLPESQAELPFRLELAEEKDLHHIVRLRPDFYTLAQIQERLKKRHLCFLGWNGNEPIHIRWAFVHSCYLPYLHRTVNINPEAVFSDEAYTISGFRCKGVYSSSENLMRKIFENMGYKRIVRVIPTWDSFLLKTAEKKAMKKIGEGGYRNMFGFRRFFWTGLIQERGRRTIFIASN